MRRNETNNNKSKSSLKENEAQTLTPVTCS
jgi:hypothetical protein